MNLRDRISWLKTKIQVDLFPHLKECFRDQITQKQRQLITILEIVEVERHVMSPEYQWMGRKLKDRYAIGRAFVAKAVYNLGTTRALIEALHTMPNLRKICGFDGSSFTVTHEGATVDGKPLEETRLDVQINQTPAAALKDIPTVCDVGCKTNAKGYKKTWIGYKLHVDTRENYAQKMLGWDKICKLTLQFGK